MVMDARFANLVPLASSPLPNDDSSGQSGISRSTGRGNTGVIANILKQTLDPVIESLSNGVPVDDKALRNLSRILGGLQSSEPGQYEGAMDRLTESVGDYIINIQKDDQNTDLEEAFDNTTKAISGLRQQFSNYFSDKVVGQLFAPRDY